MPVILSIILLALFMGCAEKQAEDHSDEFLSSVMEEAIGDWNADTLYAMSSGRFREKASIEDVRGMFAHYSVLGRLKSYKSHKKPILVDTLRDGTVNKYGVYRIEAEFENDDVIIDIMSFQTDTGWMLHGFNFKSDLLMNMPGSSRWDFMMMGPD